MLPQSQLTTGLAVVSTVVALARLIAASLFGALWTWWDSGGALVAFAVGLTISMALSFGFLGVARPWPAGEEAA